MTEPPKPIDDITENYHGGDVFSVAANVRARPSKEVDRERIVDLLSHAENGLTCEEIETRLDLKHQTASARLTELKRDGEVVVVGSRKTVTGSSAGVNHLWSKLERQRAFNF